jgi:hypothetical protein
VFRRTFSSSAHSAGRNLFSLRVGAMRPTAPSGETTVKDSKHIRECETDTLGGQPQPAARSMASDIVHQARDRILRASVGSLYHQQQMTKR